MYPSFTYTGNPIQRVLKSLGLLVAMGLLLFGTAKKATGTSQVNIGHQPRLLAVQGPLSPVVEELYNKTPEPHRSSVTNILPVTSDYTCSSGASQGCVLYLRSRGFCVPKTRNGGAGSLPVKSTELPPIGEEVYIVSRESVLGHVARGYFDGENLISTVDSAGAGRVIPLNLFKGWY
ncbi:hypothetical protein LCGC14_0417940 [marine sediment metagenome]|uniref:Uncharacterized protein n=1 Tax=marine sediment metagenome TaxID=412755 RepID=A0A0F9W0W2_9ZZZZ